jgi:hypothetical protein
MEETLPDYQTALDSLPEELDLVTLPTFKGRFFQTYEMDAETITDPPIIPPLVEPTADVVLMPAAGDTPLPELPLDPLPFTAEETRQTALTAFLAASRLRDPARIQVGDISILLHLLQDTSERLITLSRITPCITSTEAKGICEA